FAIFVSFIAYRGVSGSTGVNIGINIIQITALIIFAIIAIGYRLNHGENSTGWTLDPDGYPVNYNIANDKDGKPIKDEKTGHYQADGVKDDKGNPVLDKDGKPQISYLTLNYAGQGFQMVAPDATKPNEKQDTFMFHETAGSVISPHLGG